MLAAKLLWRNWRSGELRLLSAALVMAVTVVSAIAIFTDRLDTSLVQQSNRLLGADRVLRSPQPLPPDWYEQAEQSGLQQTRLVRFSSMAYVGETMQLTSVRAVAPGYPLRGHLEVSDELWSEQPVRAGGIPAPGEAWLDARLLTALDIELGDSVGLGDYQLTVTRVLVREPDGVGSLFMMTGGRLLMNLADLERTNVIQPGSRVDYQWLLASDDPADLESFVDWLEPQLNPHHRLQDIESSQQQLSETLERGKQFLLLAAVVGVLLAGVAIGLAARQFAERHGDQVALMKSLGADRAKVRSLYGGQMLLLGLVASALGLVLGEGLQRLIALGLLSFFDLTLAPPAILAYGLSLTSGVVCLLFFALPALWFLPSVPPLKILRRELSTPVAQLWVQALLALAAVSLLIGLFSRQWSLAFSVILALVVLILVALLLAWLLLTLSRRLSSGAGSIWRLALANLQRRRGQSLMQLVIFAVAFMLLIGLTLVRSSLIEDWRLQLPEEAPNHFLVNIAPEEVPQVQALLDRNQIDRQPLYPMVRGRLTHINGQPREESDRLNREANLTWTDQVSEDNEVVAGQWWDQWSGAELPGVSVEQDLAEDLGLKLGDRLTFSIGGLEMRAVIASLRTLDWQSMNPNFYFIFEPGALNDFAATYMTSAYIPPEQKRLVNRLMRNHPTLLVIALDRVFEQIRSVVARVTQGIQLVLMLTLVGGALVLLAAVNSSLESRKQEAGLLRALGSSRRLVVGSVWAEFSVLGGLAGLLGVVGAEALLFSLQYWVMDIPIQPHYGYWLLGPVLGATLVGTLGALGCRSVIHTPPAVVLRQAAG